MTGNPTIVDYKGDQLRPSTSGAPFPPAISVREESGLLTVFRGDEWLCRARARIESLPARQAWTGARLLVLDDFEASEAGVLESESRGAMPPLRELLRSTNIGRSQPWHVLRVDAKGQQNAVVGAAWRFALERHMPCDIGWIADDVIAVTIFGRGVRGSLARVTARMRFVEPVVDALRRRFAKLGTARRPTRGADLYVRALTAETRMKTVPGITFRVASPEEVSRRPLLYADSVQSAEIPLGAREWCVIGELDGAIVFRTWIGAVDPSWLAGVDPELVRKPSRYLHDTYTAPEFRNRGIRSAALAWLIPVLYQRGYELAWQHIMADNIPSIRSAEKAGFRRVHIENQTMMRSGAVQRVNAHKGLKLDDAGVLAVVREVLEVAGTVRVKASGNSMWPAIPDQTVVALVPAQGPLRTGEVVLIDLGGKPVLHRIVRVDRYRVQTKGDACMEWDPPTNITNVVAVASAISGQPARDV